MQEKKEKEVGLELVSSYVLRHNSKPTVIKKSATFLSSEISDENWGENLGHIYYIDEELFPCMKELEDRDNIPEINFEVFTVNLKGIRNGKAQGLTCDGNGFLLKWNGAYKNGNLHGKFTTYNYDGEVSQNVFYYNGKPVDVKTVTEWRKKRAELNAALKAAKTRSK